MVIALLAGIGGLITASGVAWAKILAIKTTHEKDLAKLKAEMDSASATRASAERADHSEREQEAFKELKQLLNERKEEMARQSARLDKLENEHSLCELKYAELRRESIEDKAKILVLEQKVNTLEQQLKAVTTGN